MQLWHISSPENNQIEQPENLFASLQAKTELKRPDQLPARDQKRWRD